MIHDTDTQKLLYRARLQLEEGQHEVALSVLQDIRTEDEEQQREVAYLRGWCYIQFKRWDDATQVLSALLPPDTEIGTQERQAEREKLVLCLLHLGIAAVNLSHYEDASLHFTACLKVLHDRRVHFPSVRIKARYSLGMTCLMRGLYSIAIQHYEEALRLCRHYHDESELANIYHGLCNAYRCISEYPKASLAGQQALLIYRKRGEHVMEARVHNHLGHVSYLLNDFREAADHYTESLALATSFNSSTMVMLNCADLADLRLAEGRLEEAKRYSNLALNNMERVDNLHMRGTTYYIIGKVTHAEAMQAEGAQRRKSNCTQHRHTRVWQMCMALVLRP